MKRAPLERRTPMPRGQGPRPRTKRTPRPPRDTAKDTAWAELRWVLHARAGGRCERCGADLDWVGMDGAHRKARSQGGPDTPVNVAALCRGCHAWCHATPSAARGEGWMVLSTGDPATTPVTLWSGRRVRFDQVGGYTEVWQSDEPPAP